MGIYYGAREGRDELKDQDSVVTLARWIAESRRIVGFTGAGVSTESGVPDFRSPGSPWLKHPPMPYQEFMASEENRREAWRRKFIMDDHYKGARPSGGHHFLVWLASAGRLAAAITQNIDGLHQAAGLAPGKVIELHGNGTYALCLDCGRRHEIAYVRGVFEQSGDPPVCTACGGILKSATISFGQAMPAEPMLRAREASEASELFIVLGSSLVVYPAASFPVIAKRSGARVVIINREQTELDRLADLLIPGEIGPIVTAVQQTSV